MTPALRPFGNLRTPVSAIGQGTWKIEAGDADRGVSALRRGIDLGLTHIDTAEMYGSGDSETIIGRAIGGRRDQVFLVSKVLPSNATKTGTIAACERSLSRLQTDHLDCYLLHWRGNHPLTETIAAFTQLQQAGKIRSWGVSNFDIDDLEEVRSIAGSGHPACNQVLYHLQERAIEHAVIPWCKQHGVAVVAYTPFGQSRQPFNPKSKSGRVLAEVAAAHGASSRQTALRFLLRDPITFVIPKASTLGHLEDNAGAARLQLTDADLAKIDAAFPCGPAARHLPMI